MLIGSEMSSGGDVTASTTRQALIVGAGIAGLTTALQLARTGWRVTIVERATGLRGGAYVVGFSGVGYDAAERLGLLDRLRALESSWTPSRHVDGEGRVLAAMDVDQQRALVGSRLISILRGDLERVLFEALRADDVSHRIDVRFGQTVVGIFDSVDTVSATLADGSMCQADLLVGADGLHSEVRRSVFGPETRFRYDLGSDVASFTLRVPPNELAERTTFLASIGRGAGVYPQRDGGLAVFFTFAADPASSSERSMHPARTLQAIYGDLGWVWPEVLDRANSCEEIFYDSISQVRMAHWRNGHVVLVGDAAWSVSLLAGYGSSLAVGGGELLGTLLAEHDDVASAVAEWERRMRPLVNRKQLVGRRSRWLFVPRNRAEAALRSTTIRLAGSHLTSAVAARVLGIAGR